MFTLGQPTPTPATAAANRVKFASAEDYASDTDKAKAYVKLREKDAIQFAKGLEWKPFNAEGFNFTYSADIYGVRILHDMTGEGLMSGGSWGELFKYAENGDVEYTERFSSFECFVAFMLARYW